jgi:hypothetical protein
MLNVVKLASLGLSCHAELVEARFEWFSLIFCVAFFTSRLCEEERRSNLTQYFVISKPCICGAFIFNGALFVAEVCTSF